MSDLPKIDVIIPAYKAQNTILRTLSSIAEQEILDDLEVTIVNDADEIGYKEFVDMFSPYMKIKEITMEKNGGPGEARQYGIDHTSNPILTFIDADDVFSGRFALKTLRLNMLSDPRIVGIFSNFLEDQQQAYIQHPNDTVWMFGKIYRRDFIEKYDIHFPPNARSNEDGAWNTLCKLYSNENEQIRFIQDITYYWCFKEDSITLQWNKKSFHSLFFSSFLLSLVFIKLLVESFITRQGVLIYHLLEDVCSGYGSIAHTIEVVNCDR